MPVAGHAATNQLSGSVPFYRGDKAHFSAQLNGRSWRSRQASSSFSKADHGMPRANLDPDIVALPISRQASTSGNGNAMGDVCSAVSSATRTPRCTVLDAAFKDKGQGQGADAPRDQRQEAQSREYQLSGVGSRHMNVSSISGGNARSNTGKHLRSR